MSQPKHAALGRPATFGDVFGVREFRMLYAATALSWVGDYLARAAVAALVFRATNSVALSAASLAVGYLPWLTAGPFLTALAERHPKRTVMMICDIARAAFIAVLVIPGLPIVAVFALLFSAALFNPAFDSSRSALLPSIVSGDKYVVALSLQNTTSGLATVFGYFVGAIAATSYPHVTLAIDAVTFLASASLIGYGIQSRPAGLDRDRQTSLLRETRAGFALVLSNPVLRAILIIVLGATVFAIVPEGLAAAWAGHLTGSRNGRGLDQALIMMSVPAGTIVGAVVAGRFLTPDVRWRLIQPFAIVVPVALAFSLANLSADGVTAIGFVVGLGVSGILLPANSIFVQVLPHAFRARAFGVILFGSQFAQVGALVATGLLSDRFAIHAVVGIWGLCGVAVMALAVAMWPRPATITEAIATARADNEATSATSHGRHSRDSDESLVSALDGAVTSPADPPEMLQPEILHDDSSIPPQPERADGMNAAIPLAPASDATAENGRRGGPC